MRERLGGKEGGRRREDRPSEWGREKTQPVGWPPDWADDAAGPAGHSPVSATSPEGVFR
jgi:hypothetical protein